MVYWVEREWTRMRGWGESWKMLWSREGAGEAE